jgi:adenosylcobinamide kinase/adenosylcobinamide-phosphate guanylyltransferase
MAEKILITGGARSGKSSFAEELAGGFAGPLCYLATAQAFDDEMHERIERHRLRRGPRWETIEEPLLVPQTLARIDGIYTAILVDCVTLWLSNLLLSLDAEDNDAEAHLLGLVHRLAGSIRNLTTPVILVTNEVGQGIVPDNALARRYRDLAGCANQILAASCDTVYVTISGIPLKLK